MLRGLLVLMVFVQHFVFTANVDLYTDPLMMLSTLARGDYAVGMLFSLSGYVLYKTWVKVDLEWVDLARRLTRLIAPMFVVFMIVYLLHVIGVGAYINTLTNLNFSSGMLQPIGMRLNVSLWDMLSSFFKLIFTGTNENYVLVAWILPFEALFSVIFFAIVFVSKRMKKMPTMFILMAVVIIGAVDVYSALMKGLAAAFCFGVLMSIMESKKRVSLYSPVWIAIAMLALFQGQKIAMSGHQWLPTLINQGFEGYVFSIMEANYFYYGLMFSLYAFVCNFLNAKGMRRRLFGWLSWVGQRSYSFHMMGQVSIMIAAAVVKIYSAGNDSLFIGNSFMLFLIEVFIVFAAVQLFYSLVEVKTNISRKAFKGFLKSANRLLRSKFANQNVMKQIPVKLEKGES